MAGGSWPSWRRLRALCWKETLQIFRDPSSILIAFFMPVLMLFIFGFGINLDFSRLRIGLRMEDGGVEAAAFAAALEGSPWLDVHSYDSREAMERAVVDSQIRGFVVIPEDFSRRMHQPGETAPVQLILDGRNSNTAAIAMGYAQAAVVYTGDSYSDLTRSDRSYTGLQDAYTIVDLAFGLTRGDYTIDFFLKNAFDELARTSTGVPCAYFTCGINPYYYPNQPRTIGIRFSQEF